MIINFNGEGIKTLEAKVSLPTSGKSVALNGERLDNAAFVVMGSNTMWPDLADKNNVGFLYDIPPTRKIFV